MTTLIGRWHQMTMHKSSSPSIIVMSKGSREENKSISRFQKPFKKKKEEKDQAPSKHTGTSEQPSIEKYVFCVKMVTTWHLQRQRKMQLLRKSTNDQFRSMCHPKPADRLHTSQFSQVFFFFFYIRKYSCIMDMIKKKDMAFWEFFFFFRNSVLKCKIQKQLYQHM